MDVLTVWDGVCVGSVAAVPVGGDTFISESPGEVVVWAGDGVEALEHISVQNTFWCLGGVVRHEAVDEGESCLADSHTSKWLVGEVWVLGYVSSSLQFQSV